MQWLANFRQIYTSLDDQKDVSFFHQFREKLSLGDFMTGFWVQVTNRAFFFDYDVIHRWHRPFEVYDVI